MATRTILGPVANVPAGTLIQISNLSGFAVGSTFHPPAPKSTTTNADGSIGSGGAGLAIPVPDSGTVLHRIEIIGTGVGASFEAPIGAGASITIAALWALIGTDPDDESAFEALLNAHAGVKASAGALGHIRVGPGLAIDGDGILSVTGGGGGGVSGSGTTGRIPQWSGSTALGDSTLVKSGAGVLTLSAGSAASARLGATGTAAGVHVPWESGDALPALVAGATTTGNNQTAIDGRSDSGTGVRGEAVSGTGVRGLSTSSLGGHFTGNDAAGVLAERAGSNTDTVLNAIELRGATSGTPGVGYGVRARLTLKSTTTAAQLAGEIAASWAEATHASRKSRLTLSAFDHNDTAREGLRIEASGTSALISFFGGAAAAKPVVSGSRGANPALASMLTGLAGLNLLTDSTTEGTAPGTSEVNESLDPFTAHFPSSNFAALTAVNRRPCLAFDPSTAETVYWQFLAPGTIPAGTHTLLVSYCMASATSGGVVFSAAVEAVSDGDTIDLDSATSFDSANTSSTSTVPGTAGYLKTVAITLTAVDSIAAGDYVRISLTRETANAGDTASGDCYVLGARWRVA
jgi:hypothetical protein